VTRSYKEAGDVGRARENAQALQMQLDDLNAQFEAEVEALSGAGDALTESLEKTVVKLKRTGVTVQAVALAWTPDGGAGG